MYLKSKKRLFLLLTINIYLVYNVINPRVEESCILALALLPMGILSLNDCIKRRQE